MLKLKNLNESFEKLYNTDSSLNESVILTEAFNESFPSWLKTALIKSRNEFGYRHRQTQSDVHRDYRNSNFADFKKRRGDRQYTTTREKSLFNNAMRAGFFNVTVHEAEMPTNARQVVKDPYIPIWGLAGGQVYIPGFNDLEKSNYSGKAFENMTAKALIDESIHYAYFDKNELDPQSYASLTKERDDRLASQQAYYKEHPNEYNLYKNTVGDVQDYKLRSDKRDYLRYGSNNYSYKKWDKSGYNVDISDLKARARALMGTKAKQIAVEWGENLQKCVKLFKRVIRQQDVFELSDVFEKFSLALPRLIEDYQALVKSLEKIEKAYDYDPQEMNQQLGRRVDSEKESIQMTKDFLTIFEGVDPYKDASEVDWLS